MPQRPERSPHATHPVPSRRECFRAALIELAELDTSDLDAALRRILSVDADMLQVARVSYWELATDHSGMRCRVLYQREAGTFQEGGDLRAADFPRYFEAMLETRTIAAHDAWTDPRTSEFRERYFQPYDIRSLLDVPVWRRGKLAGVVCHEQVGTARTWAADEQDFVLGIGNMVSVAVEAVDRRRAEEGFALVARATNEVLRDWDMTRDVVEWDDALCGVFRHRPEDVIPDAQWWLERVHPDDVVRIKRKLTTLLDSERTSWNEQYRWVRGDGTTATVMDRSVLVRNERGVAIRLVGSMLDVTERVEMRLALSDRTASIATLAAGVAHEINNPLTYITANLTTAMEELSAGPCEHEALIELLRDAHEGAERVRRVVRDLAILARPREDEVEHLDVRPIVESSISRAWNEIDLESPPSGGCIVRIALPAAPASTRIVKASDPDFGPRRRVLLVDDEAPIRRTLRRMLEPRHDVVVAESGESALEQVHDGSRYDVVLCDLMMPRMTGMELYERLVAVQSPLARRIIFMTGGAFTDRSRAFLATCDRPLLEKPIDKATLRRAIATVEL